MNCLRHRSKRSARFALIAANKGMEPRTYRAGLTMAVAWLELCGATSYGC